jgi:hypothetical protein
MFALEHQHIHFIHQNLIMLRQSALLGRSFRHVPLGNRAGIASMASMKTMGGKREGDISDSFASLSGKQAEPLPDRFRLLKLQLVSGNEEAVVASWKRLLLALRRGNKLVARRGSGVIPEVDFANIHDDLKRKAADIKKRGVAVVRRVIPEDEARAYKFEIEEYVRRNPQTRGEYPLHETARFVSV